MMNEPARIGQKPNKKTMNEEMTETELMEAIAPKSDQLNADDLIGGPLDIAITAVKRGNAEQKLVVHYGDKTRPWKPCKSMSRVMVSAWGKNPVQWVGQSLRLFRDPDAIYGGQKVGGIRISHMSGIEARREFLLTVRRGARAAWPVDPMPSAPKAAQAKQEPAKPVDVLEVNAAAQKAASAGVESFREHWKTLSKEEREILDTNELKKLAEQADAKTDAKTEK
jgi:hypothetical protein